MPEQFASADNKRYVTVVIEEHPRLLEEKFQGAKFVGESSLLNLDRKVLLFAAKDGKNYGMAPVEPARVGVVPPQAESVIGKTQAALLVSWCQKHQGLEMCAGDEVAKCTVMDALLEGRARSVLIFEFSHGRFIVTAGRYVILRESP